MHKLVNIAAAAIIASGLVQFCAAPSSIVDRGHAARAAAPPARAATMQLPNVATLAERVNPTVVSIESEHQVEFSQHMPFSDDWPFGGDSPFRFFFKNLPEGKQTQRGLGSGVVIDDDVVLTNHHVVENADSIDVVVSGPDGSDRTLHAKVIGKAPAYDVALVQTDGPIGAPAATLGDSDAVRIGDWVMAIGTPFGLSHSVSVGIVSAKGRREVAPSGQQGVYDFIQTDASINPGNSGGPLVNMRGEVIGINTAINAAGQGIGFAIPINMVKKLLPQLREHGSFTRAWIGVMVQPVDDDLAQSFGLEKARGALVSQVIDGSPADDAGLEPGDIILEFDGKPVHASSDLPLLASLAGVGSKAEIRIFRNGDEKTVTLQLGAFPKDENVASADDSEHGGRLGLAVADLTPERRDRLGTDLSKGAVVTHVDAGSPAARAGLRPGDIITAVGRRSVKTAAEFAATTDHLKPSQIVRMQVQREGGSFFVAVRVPAEQ